MCVCSVCVSVCICVCVYVCQESRVFHLTLQWEDLVAMDHDAELQYQLGGALEEGLQQAQHVDVGALKHQAPVEVPPLQVAVEAALHAQEQDVNIPEETHRLTVRSMTHYRRV